MVSGDGWVRRAFGGTGEGAACAGVIVEDTSEARRAKRPTDGDGLGVLEREDWEEAR